MASGYSQSFDAKWYLKTHFRKVQDDNGSKEFLLNTFYDIFASGKIKGDTLLEIGSGPTISNIIIPSYRFNHVYLSDFGYDNRRILDKWCRDPSFHDYSDFFKYVVAKRDQGQTWDQLQEEVLRKIRGVLFCDVRDSNPLKPCFFPQFDALTIPFCLHAVSSSIEEYLQFVNNISGLLKPGGWIIEAGYLGGTHYVVNGVRFNMMCLTKDDVCKVWTELPGFDMEIWKEFRPPPEVRSKTSDYQGVYVMAARKIHDTV